MRPCFHANVTYCFANSKNYKTLFEGKIKSGPFTSPGSYHSSMLLRKKKCSDYGELSVRVTDLLAVRHIWCSLASNPSLIIKDTMIVADAEIISVLSPR